ncbi:MAG: hypothetical protein CM15mP127_14570 [Gammaproteobacteria bacterium]|nr:MAG: hypothetical protein CM15mP127_14570 [Gammaproteobacteria bacterium]
MLTKILQGGQDKAKEAEYPLLEDILLMIKNQNMALVVTGEVEESKMWTNSGAN